jgi:hypothetical protein
MKPSKLQHRVTRTRVNGGKLLEFPWLLRPLGIRRVLVHPKKVAFGSSPGGAIQPVYGQSAVLFVGLSFRIEPEDSNAHGE